LNQTIQHKEAGCLILQPVSVHRAAGTNPPATAEADPELEPQGTL